MTYSNIIQKLNTLEGELSSLNRYLRKVQEEIDELKPEEGTKYVHNEELTDLQLQAYDMSNYRLRLIGRINKLKDKA